MKIYSNIIKYLYRKIKKRTLVVGDIVSIENNEIVLLSIRNWSERLPDLYIVTSSNPLTIELFSDKESREKEWRKNPITDEAMKRWDDWARGSDNNLTKGEQYDNYT